MKAQGDKNWLVLLLGKEKKDIVGINKMVNEMRKQEIKKKK
jgi:hypothetical protein